VVSLVDSGWNKVKAMIFSGENHDRGSSFAETKLDLICLAHFFLSDSHSQQENNEKCLTYS